MPMHSSSLQTRMSRSAPSRAIGRNSPALVTMSGTERTNSTPAALMAARMRPPLSSALAWSVAASICAALPPPLRRGAPCGRPGGHKGRPYVIRNRGRRQLRPVVVVPAGEPGPIRRSLSRGHGAWVPACAGTTVRLDLPRPPPYVAGRSLNRAYEQSPTGPRRAGGHRPTARCALGRQSCLLETLFLETLFLETL